MVSGSGPTRVGSARFLEPERADARLRRERPLPAPSCRRGRRGSSRRPTVGPSGWPRPRRRHPRLAGPGRASGPVPEAPRSIPRRSSPMAAATRRGRRARRRASDLACDARAAVTRQEIMLVLDSEFASRSARGPGPSSGGTGDPPALAGSESADSESGVLASSIWLAG